MRAVSGLFASLFTVSAPVTALAHGDHLNEIGGHSHWIGFAALGAVIIIAALAAWSAEGKKAENQPDAAPDTLEG